MKLNDAQIKEFHEKGFLVVEGLFANDDLNPVIEEYSDIIDHRAQCSLADGKIEALHEKETFERRLACLAKEAPEIASNLDIMQTRKRGAFNFLKNPKILDLSESIVGPEILCNPIQHIRAILPHHQSAGHPIPWHQDTGVAWPEVDPYFMLTIWVPIVDATLDNGCLEVMPESHKLGLFPHKRTPQGLGIPCDDLPDIKSLPLPVTTGSAILFNNYTLHHARANESQGVRWSLDLRYHDAYQPTGRPFYPSFLFRSKIRPDALQTDYETWCQRWEFSLEHSKGAEHFRWPK